MKVLYWLLVIVLGYSLGNINGALLLSRWVHHDDVRTHGSGNAGLTNFFRTYGGLQSLLVIAIDVVKCIAACLIAAWLLPEYAQTARLAAGLATILGHSYPAAEGFRGGKGILCGVALIGCVDLRILAIVLAVFILALLLTRYVSLGSVLAAALFPVLYAVFHWGSWLDCAIALVTGGFVVFRHRENIVRLLKGTENKFSFHKK